MDSNLFQCQCHPITQSETPPPTGFRHPAWPETALSVEAFSVSENQGVFVKHYMKIQADKICGDD